MIKGQAKTEAVYRAILLDSSSSLKEFSMDRKKYYNKYYSRKNNDGKYLFKRFNCNIVLNNDTLFPYKDEYTIKGIELFSDIEEPSIQVAITYDRIHRTYDNDGKEIITSDGKDLTLVFKTFDLFETWYKTLYNIQNK